MKQGVVYKPDYELFFNNTRKKYMTTQNVVEKNKDEFIEYFRREMVAVIGITENRYSIEEVVE